MARSTRSGDKPGAPTADGRTVATDASAEQGPPAARDGPTPAGDIRDPVDTAPPEGHRHPDAPEIPDAEVIEPDRKVAATDPLSPETSSAVPDGSGHDEPAPAASRSEVQAAGTVPPTRPLQAPRPAFVPMVLGGVVAAALGYAAAWTDMLPRPPDPALSARIDAVAAAQSDLTVAVTELAARPSMDADARARLDAVESLQAQAAADLAAGLDALSAESRVLSSETVALGDRLTALEERPQVTVALSEQAQAAVEAQIAALRQEAADGIARIEEDRGALAAQADERFAALEADLRATLATIEAERASLEAARAAAAAEARASRLAAAVADLRAALDAGMPFAAPLAALSDLVGTAPPAELSAHADDGIPSLAALRDAFPEAARAAVEQVLRAQVASGEVGRVEGFMRIQSGVRSLTPQDGDDADAVLSRAEAALAAGDLTGALALVAALPDPGRDAMQGWADLAQVRRAALDALAGYGNS